MRASEVMPANNPRLRPDQMYEQQCTIPILRSILFVPTILVRFVARAPVTGADAACLDVEDSVPPAEKPTARAAAAEATEGRPQRGSGTVGR